MNALRETLIAWGPLGVLALAVIESAGVPTPSGTDAMILLLSIARPEQAWLLAVLAIVGSLIGSAIFHAIVSKSGDKLLRKHTSVGRGAKFRAWFMRYGLATVFVCALVPIPVMPMKVVALCACALGVSRGKYLALIAAARIPRYAGMAYLGSQLGENSNQWLRDHLWQMGIFALVLFAGLFVLLKLSDRGQVPQPAE